MSVELICETSTEVTYQVTISLCGSMLEAEEAIQKKLNEIGLAATQKKLEAFDTDGSPIVVGNKKFTSKGKTLKNYETLYGVASVERHVYQSNEGGKTFCPLDDRARIILHATPRFAKIVSFKYAQNGADAVLADLIECHQRKISNRTIKSLGDVVGDFATAKEEHWEYELPPFERKVSSIGIGVDGTCMQMHDDGWREAMCGSVAFYDAKGERMHTIYLGQTPEYGKETFHETMLREVNRVKEKFPDVPTIGLADGAKDNWSFLEPLTDRQVVDFWHVSEYVGKASKILFPKKSQNEERESWLENCLHRLKHNHGAASRLLKELKEHLETLNSQKKLTRERKSTLQSVVTYLTNQKHRMNYAYEVERHCPIGSGVTESACKLLIKSRFCKSGARWKDDGARAMMSIRSLRLTEGRWKAFWKKIDQYGFYKR